MGTMASQITSLTIVYSTVYSGVDQRKHQSFASLSFVRGIHRWPVTRKMFPLDDIIMQLHFHIHIKVFMWHERILVTYFLSCWPQVGPMSAPWTLLSGTRMLTPLCRASISTLILGVWGARKTTIECTVVRLWNEMQPTGSRVCARSLGRWQKVSPGTQFGRTYEGKGV